MTRRQRILLVGLTALCAFFSRISTPRADIETFWNIKVPDPKDQKDKGKAPSIEVTVIGGPNVPLDKFSISTTVANQKVSMKAEKLRPYAEGGETIAIALVINGQMIWIGTEDYATDENLKYPGALKNLEQAIDKLQLASVEPKDSKGVLVSYSTGAEIKLQMGDLKFMTGSALGNQKDYDGKTGTDMVQGITMGLTELEKVTTDRKALIVVGDGNDTNNEKAKGALAELKKQATKMNTQMFAIIYKSVVSTEGAVITTMIPNAKTVNSVDGIAAELNNIVARMADRYYLSFPGWDDKLQQGLPWDGKDHDMVVRIDQQDLDPFTATLSPKWDPPHKGGVPWLVIILVVVGVLLLIIIGVKVFGSKPVPAPMPMPMQMAPMPEAPKPAGPMKTVMIGVGGDQEGFPIVGWLVALNGVDAYRTQRLKPGLTKIGTAPPSDMIVNDGFMSTEHCSISCSPAGFVLSDNGSTNGCYVNDKKVSKHDLVDNDMILSLIHI